MTVEKNCKAGIFLYFGSKSQLPVVVLLTNHPTIQLFWQNDDQQRPTTLNTWMELTTLIANKSTETKRRVSGSKSPTTVLLILFTNHPTIQVFWHNDDRRTTALNTWMELTTLTANNRTETRRTIMNNLIQHNLTRRLRRRVDIKPKPSPRPAPHVPPPHKLGCSTYCYKYYHYAFCPHQSRSHPPPHFWPPGFGYCYWRR